MHSSVHAVGLEKRKLLSAASACPNAKIRLLQSQYDRLKLVRNARIHRIRDITLYREVRSQGTHD